FHSEKNISENRVTGANVKHFSIDNIETGCLRCALLFRNFTAMRILVIFGWCLFGMNLQAQDFFKEKFYSEENAVQIVPGQILVQLQPNIFAIQFSKYFKQENPFVKFETVEQLALSWNIWLFETEAGHEQEVLLQVRKM